MRLMQLNFITQDLLLQPVTSINRNFNRDSLASVLNSVPE